MPRNTSYLLVFKNGKKCCTHNTNCPGCMTLALMLRCGLLTQLARGLYRNRKKKPAGIQVTSSRLGRWGEWFMWAAGIQGMMIKQILVVSVQFQRLTGCAPHWLWISYTDSEFLCARRVDELQRWRERGPQPCSSSVFASLDLLAFRGNCSKSNWWAHLLIARCRETANRTSCRPNFAFHQQQLEERGVKIKYSAAGNEPMMRMNWV